MLLLSNPRTITVDGVTVLPDHADPDQFWYLPAPVTLARRGRDQAAQFTLIVYKPAAVAAGVTGGGFLTFESALRLEPETERKILSRLASVSRRPRLSAVPFEEGTVQCIALNLQGGGGATAGGAPAGTFNAVESILGATSPSLHGHNAAAFSLRVSQEGATILREAFKKEGAPVGVLYSLKFTGLLPAMEVTIKADMKRVYQHFSAGLSASVYFVQAAIEAGIEKLKEDKAIEITVSHFTTDSDRAQKEQQALQMFKDLVLNDFFKPSLTPGQLMGGGATAPPIGGGGGGGTTQPTGGDGTTRPTGGEVKPPDGGEVKPPEVKPPDGGEVKPPDGGEVKPPEVKPADGGEVKPPEVKPPDGGEVKPPAGASPISVSFKLKFIRQEELKTATLSYKSQQAVQRSYNPQGFIGLLTKDLDAARHVIEVDLDDPFFRQMAVTVDAPIDFARIGLHSAQVALDYGNPADAATHRHKDVVFDKQRTGEQVWQFFLNQNRETEFAYRVQYHFDPASGWEGESLSYDLGQRRSEDRTLYVNPFEDLRFSEYSVTPRGIDFGIVDFTEVMLRYQASSGWSKEKTVVLRPDAGAQVWKLRTPATSLPEIRYRARHHLKDGSIRESAESTTTQTAILVDDPFPEALEVVFFPFFDGSQVRKVFVDVEYNDPDNRYQRKERLEIPGTATDEIRFRIALMNPARRRFKYRVTFVTTTGVRQKPPVETEDTIVSISE